MATTDVFSIIDYSQIFGGQTQWWWLNEIPDDGSVYVLTAYPLDVFSADRVDPEGEVEVVNVAIYRQPGFRASLTLDFGVKNRLETAVSYQVFLATIHP